MRWKRHLVLGWAIAAVLAASAGVCDSCPFCTVAPTLTLSDYVAQSDAVALGRWTETRMPKNGDPGSTVYEVVQLAKSPKGTVEKGVRITLVRYREGKPGDLVLLLGKKGKESPLDWKCGGKMTDASSFQYIAQAPLPDAPTQQRLAYFLKFLEFPDPLVADDAYCEFAKAPYQDIAALASTFPREKLREWTFDKEIWSSRLGLYGLMLGLCGNQEDAAKLEKTIAEPTQDLRLGIDGVISGYLLLTGEKGLDNIEKLKLTHRKAPFNETYGMMQALRFLRNNAEGKIPNERLIKSMRLLLYRPDVADLVIADLARWEDWGVQDNVMEMYDHKNYQRPAIKRAIVRYTRRSSKFEASSPNVETPAHVLAGRKYLDVLREKDPKTIKEVDRFPLWN